MPDEPEGLAKQLLKLCSNIEARVVFQNKLNLSSLWMSHPTKIFKIAHLNSRKKRLLFATPYGCKQGFSTQVNIKTKTEIGCALKKAVNWR